MKFILTSIFLSFPILLISQIATFPLDSFSISELKKNCSPEGYDTFPNGNFKQCLLTNTVLINNVLCRDWIKLHENQRIKQFQPVTDIQISGIRIPGASTVIFDSSGNLIECWFSEDTRIKDILIKGGLMKIPITFYNNGQVACCYLAEEKVINGVPCKSGMLAPVCFYPNGKIKSCTLSENITLGKEKFVKGNKLQFGLDGKIKVITD